MNKVKVAQWDTLKDREPAYALVANVDLPGQVDAHIRNNPLPSSLNVIHHFIINLAATCEL